MSLMHPGAFYPPSLLFLLEDFLFAFNAYFLFHFFVLTGSVYALCRYWERSVSSSLFAACTALLGGYFLSLSTLYNQFQTAIWLPSILLLWQKFQAEGQFKYFTGAAVFLTFQVLGGGPENAIFSVLLIYAHSFFLAKDEEKISGFKKISFGIFVLGITAIFLAALQWVPTFYLLQEITRGEGLNFFNSTRWSLEPHSLLDLFLPENFTRFLERIKEDLNYMDYFLQSFYMGILPLFILLGCLLVGREQREIRFWLVVFFSGVFFALGKFNPLYALFHEWVPIFNMFRFPQKFFFFCAYALVFLSAWALDRFVRGITENRKEMKKLLLAVLLTAMGVAGVWGMNTSRFGLENLLILTLLAAGIYALHFKKINATAFLSAVLVLMLLDLMGKNSMLIPLIDRKFYTEPPPLARRLGGTADSFRVYNGMLPEKMVPQEISTDLGEAAENFIQKSETAV